MRKRIAIMMALVLCTATFALFNIVKNVNAPPPSSEGMRLGGFIYVCNNTTPLNGTAWEDTTNFAILVNNTTATSPFYKWTRYPQIGWYVTDKGYYSAVLPYADKDVNWSHGAEYRIEVDGAPWGYSIENATSNGTGSYKSTGGGVPIPPDGTPEFPPFGNVSNNISYWEWEEPPGSGTILKDDYQGWDVVTVCIDVVVLELPSPPSPWLDADDETGKITIMWDNVTGEEVEKYHIYWAESPEELDFSEPQANVTASGDKISYDHEDGIEAAKELYYVIRSVDIGAKEGASSDIVGKFTMEIPQGYSTFSLPLEPFGLDPCGGATHRVSCYLEDMDLDQDDVIFSYDASHQKWIPHPRFLPAGVSDFELSMGETYTVYSREGKAHYTFVGRPGTTIRYLSSVDDPRIGADEEFRGSLRAEEDGNDIILTWDWKDEWNVSVAESLGGFNIYRTESRGGFDFSKPYANLTGYQLTWADENAAGDEHYYMVIPVNENDREGSSTLAIGVKRVAYGKEHSGFALYLKPLEHKAISSYLIDFNLANEEIIGTIFFFDDATQSWVPHPAFLPKGVADPKVALGDGNMIYLLKSKEYTFVGR